MTMNEPMNNAFHAAFRDHHSRAVHAKGILVQGTFTPATEARAITKRSCSP
jgi:catalase